VGTKVVWYTRCVLLDIVLLKDGELAKDFEYGEQQLLTVVMLVLTWTRQLSIYCRPI